MRELGVSKDAKARALRQLEAAGLVAIERKRGRSPVITITQERKNV
jgi:predicted transcriptional regulator